MAGRQITIEQFVEATSGPLPDPKILKAYDDILPGAANRIVAMAEAEQKHQHGLQDAIVGSHFVATRLGQIFAFVIGLTGMVIGGILIYADKPITGLASFFVPLAALAGIYLNESRQKSGKPTQPAGANTPAAPRDK